MESAALLTFYVQTWDEYHTKTLTLGIVNGPVEGILILVTVYAFTAIKGGASFWQQSMFRTVGIPKTAFIPEYIYELPFNEWYMVQGGVVLVLNTIQRYFQPSSPTTQTLTCQFPKCNQGTSSSRRQISIRSCRAPPILRHLDSYPIIPVPQPRNPLQPSRAFRLLRWPRQRLLCGPDDHCALGQARLSLSKRPDPAACIRSFR